MLTPQIHTDKKSSAHQQQKVLQGKIDRREKGRGILSERKLELDALKIKRKKYQKEKNNHKVLKAKIAENHLVIKNTLSHTEVIK